MTETDSILSRAQIMEILVERDGDACYLCPRPWTEEDFATIEHVVPLSRGGTWDLDNLRLAHRICNQKKGDRLLLEDGTLEPRVERLGYRARKAQKSRILDEFCELCMDGRLLLPDEICPDCDKEAVQWPWSTKVQPKDCPHAGVFWCWCCCIGIYERQPAIVTVLDGDVDPD